MYLPQTHQSVWLCSGDSWCWEASDCFEGHVHSPSVKEKRCSPRRSPRKLGYVTKEFLEVSWFGANVLPVPQYEQFSLSFRMNTVCLNTVVAWSQLSDLVPTRRPLSLCHIHHHLTKKHRKSRGSYLLFTDVPKNLNRGWHMVSAPWIPAVWINALRGFEWSLRYWDKWKTRVVS